MLVFSSSIGQIKLGILRESHFVILGIRLKKTYVIVFSGSDSIGQRIEVLINFKIFQEKFGEIGVRQIKSRCRGVWSLSPTSF